MKQILLFCFLFFLQTLSAKLPGLIPYRKGELWGYCDSTKKIIITPQFDHAEFFSGNTAVVTKDGRLGLIDREGHPVSPFAAREIDPKAHAGNRLYQADTTENNALMNEKGENLIPPVRGFLTWISEDYLIACECKDSTWADSSITVAVYNKTGRMLSGYEYVLNLGCWASDREAGKYGLIVLAKGEKEVGVIDSTGKIIVPFEFDEITFSSCTGPLLQCRKGDCMELRTPAGSMLETAVACPPAKQFPKAVRTNERTIFNGAWQDSAGNLITLPGLLDADPFSNGYAVFMEQSQKCGIVDEHFKVIIPAKYGLIEPVDENGMAYVRTANILVESALYMMGKNGYIDMHGTEYWED